MLTVDLNCDMGEGMSADQELMRWISSANIACGYHAGNEDTIRKTVRLALQYNVAIGAHPGFDDKSNFGRTEMNLSPGEVYQLTIQQIIILQTICDEENASLHHVKPHGALYNMAAKDARLAAAIASAVFDIGKNVLLYGLSGSCLISEARKIGLRTASEVFADRAYTNEGNLVPRSNPGALITDNAMSVAQVLQMIQKQSVTSINGTLVPIVADTVCIHGDGAHAVAFAKTIHTQLQQYNIEIKTIRN
jgi:UPF0271 protein